MSNLEVLEVARRICPITGKPCLKKKCKIYAEAYIEGRKRHLCLLSLTKIGIITVVFTVGSKILANTLEYGGELK